jgi:hypothetical protein
MPLGLLSEPVLAANQGDAATFGPSYFGNLLDKEGPEGIVSRLYVAPPDLMTPLFTGISTGAAEWIDIYDRFRPGVDSADLSGVTKARLDDALARALGRETESVLLYLHRHPQIPTGPICGRSPSQADDPAGVLEPREMLMLIQRKRKVAAVTAPSLREVRTACLAALSNLLGRQLRIYLVSYGAEGAKSKAVADLSDMERRELEQMVAAARKDPNLRARGDGSYPDGPFRLARIPRDVYKLCAGDRVAIANPEGPWEMSDAISDDRLPFVRLLNACRVAADEWDLTCQHGGFAPYLRHVRVQMSHETWTVVQEDDTRRIRSTRQGRRMDPWVECRSLSKSQPPLQQPGTPQ